MFPHATDMNDKENPRDLAAGMRQYYGETLQSSADLRTSACCTASAMPKSLREILPLLHTEVKDRFYGCGSPIPPLLEDATVLDLGCGAGRDVYLLSKLVGESGSVIGVDMTPQQLESRSVIANSTLVRSATRSAMSSFCRAIWAISPRWAWRWPASM